MGKGMKSPTCNRSQLAKKYGVSTVTVDSWIRRGLPHRRRKSGRRDYVFELWEVAEWRSAQLAEDSQRRGNPMGRRPIPNGARGWLDHLIVGQDQMLPWLVDQVEPGPQTEHVVTVEEYKKIAKVDGDELLMRLAFGLPTLPPAPGDRKRRARISLPHARVWLFLFSGCVESLGGNGLAERIANEAQRLRGFPADGGGDVDDDELQDPSSMEASP